MATRLRQTAAEPASTLDPSQSDLFSDFKISRRLFKINRDQKKLLDHPAAWAQLPARHGQLRSMNVPPGVLISIKEFQRQLATIDQRQDGPSPEQELVSDDVSDSNHTTPKSTCVADTVRTSVEIGNEDDQDDAVDDSSGSEDEDRAAREISWSTSPPRRCDQQHDHVDNSTSRMRSQFITQLPPGSSSPVAQATHRRDPLNDIPTSSIDNDIELEVEIPTALTDNRPTGPCMVQDTRSTIASPPSAQITVPFTCDRSEVSPEKRRQNKSLAPKQRPYKKIQSLYQGPQNQISHTTQLSLKRPPGEMPSATPLNDVTSSIIPNTTPRHRPTRQLPALDHQESAAQPPITCISRERKVSPAQVPDGRSTHSKPSSPSLRSSPPILGSVQINTVPSSGSIAPFIRYTMAYPTYNGSIREFMDACLYIYQRPRKIRTSLYDDFIRAWFEGYIPYVHQCDEPMAAIDWYNEIDDDPSFTSRVVTRQNLQATIDFYPDEVRRSQRDAERTESPERADLPLGRDTRSPERLPFPSAPKLHDGATSMPRVMPEKAFEVTLAQATEPLPEPAQHIKAIHSVEKPVSNEGEPKVAPTATRARLSPESTTSTKRKLSKDEDHHSNSAHPSKRVVSGGASSRGASPTVSAAAVAAQTARTPSLSATPASTMASTVESGVRSKAKKKMARFRDNPEKFARMYRMLKRPSTDTIVSSTAMSSTPGPVRKQ